MEEGQAYLFEPFPAPLVEGQTYTVNYNGTAYECECFAGSMDGIPLTCLGNGALLGEESDTEEPFFFAVLMDDGIAAALGVYGLIISLDSTESITLSISGSAEIVHKLDKKYIDIEVPNSNIVNGSTPGSLRSVFSIETEEEPMGEAAVAFNMNTKAIGACSFAVGNGTTASGLDAFAEGCLTSAEGEYSHAEGYGTEASKFASHAEGESTVASGLVSHAEGINTIARGYASHAEGEGTVAKSSYQHVQGKYNIDDSENKYAHIVGNGLYEEDRSNAHTLDWQGNAWFAGDVYVGGASQDDGEKLLKESDLENIGQALEGTLKWDNFSEISFREPEEFILPLTEVKEFETVVQTWRGNLPYYSGFEDIVVGRVYEITLNDISYKIIPKQSEFSSTLYLSNIDLNTRDIERLFSGEFVIVIPEGDALHSYIVISHYDEPHITVSIKDLSFDKGYKRNFPNHFLSCFDRASEKIIFDSRSYNIINDLDVGLCACQTEVFFKFPKENNGYNVYYNDKLYFDIPLRIRFDGSYTENYISIGNRSLLNMREEDTGEPFLFLITLYTDPYLPEQNFPDTNRTFRCFFRLNEDGSIPTVKLTKKDYKLKDSYLKNDKAWYSETVNVGGTDNLTAPTSLASNGLILTDESTGTKYRVFIKDAKLNLEVV